MADDANQSVAVWDSEPTDGGAPVQVQMIRSYADEQIALWPRRYRFARDGETPPTERSDGKPIKDIPE
jgi:hypothetical protein